MGGQKILVPYIRDKKPAHPPKSSAPGRKFCGFPKLRLEFNNIHPGKLSTPSEWLAIDNPKKSLLNSLKNISVYLDVSHEITLTGFLRYIASL